MSYGTIFLAILVLFIALAMGVPMAIKKRASHTSPTIGDTSKMKVNMKWWLGPLLLWLLFWTEIYCFLPKQWNLILNNQALLWIAFAIYGGLVWSNKKVRLNRDGEEKIPSYLKILGFAVLLLFFVGLKDAEKNAFAPKSDTQPHNQSLISPKRSTLPAITKRFQVRPGEVSIAVIPAGYHLAHTGGTENLILRQTELPDHSCEWELETKDQNTYEVRLDCEPDTQ